jgi:hypothetical protein
VAAGAQPGPVPRPACSTRPAGRPVVPLDPLGGAALPEVVVEGHRVLVFSSFTGALGTVRARPEAHGLPYAYHDGRTRTGSGGSTRSAAGARRSS